MKARAARGRRQPRSRPQCMEARQGRGRTRHAAPTRGVVMQPEQQPSPPPAPQAAGPVARAVADASPIASAAPAAAPVEEPNLLREGLRRERTAPPCTLVIFGASGDL